MADHTERRDAGTAWATTRLLLAGFLLTSLGGLTAIRLTDHPWLGFSSGYDTHPVAMYVCGCVVLPVGWLVALAVTGNRRPPAALPSAAGRLLLAALVTTGATSTALVALGVSPSRAAVGTALAAGFGYLLLARIIAHIVPLLGRLLRPSARPSGA